MNNNIQKHMSRYLLRIVGVIFGCGVFLPAISVAELPSISTEETLFPYEIQWQTYDPTTDVATTDIASGLIAPDVTEDNASLIQRLTDYFRLSGTQYDDPEAPATSYIKWILNILLWLVSLLSLVMIIFAFYLIFFSKWDEAVTKAKKILIGVGIALAIMGLSRFIASFFFDIYGTVTWA